MSYKHLTNSDRARIAALKRAGLSRLAIARQLGKHHSTISRELTRNKIGRTDYNARTAQQKTAARRIQANQRFHKLVAGAKLTQYVVRRLKRYWSPEQIAGRLKHETGKDIVSYWAIYQYVLAHPHLKRYLRRLKPYRRRWGTTKRQQIRNVTSKRSIDARPEAANHRSRIGDWEGDTVVGIAGGDRLATYADRKSGKANALKAPGGNGLAEAVADRTVAWLQKLPRAKRHTLTYDNGTEFSQHEYIEANSSLQVYFAHPYHSWERGTNENTNGLYRQFFPKKTDLNPVSQREIDKVTRLLNTRPRKRHEFRTPDEVFRGRE
jgi:transposase, IS30 family